jgi:double-strand break repair protein MRE11
MSDLAPNDARGEETAQSVAPSDVLEDPDEHTLRMMLSTDNHLGYAEKDPVRGKCLLMLWL